MNLRYLFLTTILGCSAVTASLQAQTPGTLDATFQPVFSSIAEAGIVFSWAVHPDGHIWAGGFIQGINSQAHSNLARLQANGTPLRVSPEPNGNVISLCVQNDGKVLAAGNFTTDNNSSRLMRYDANGTLEGLSSFNPPRVQYTIFSALVQPDGKILYVGTGPRIQRLNANGSVESSSTWNPGTGPDETVFTAALQPDGKILIGGTFTAVNGTARGRIARLLPNGSVENTATFNSGSGASRSVTCIAVQPDGKILVGGDFTSFNDQPRNRIARLNSDGTLESTTTFNPGSGADGVIYSITLQADGKILAGGSFNTFNGQTRRGIVRLNPDGSVESTATFNIGSGTVGGYVPGAIALGLQPDGKILAGGYFAEFNGATRMGAARLHNNPAMQTLSRAGTSQIRWMRSGGAPEVDHATFEYSTNGGTSWTVIGNATRISGGWERTTGALPATGMLRARGKTHGGMYNATSGLVEQITSFGPGSLDTDFAPQLTGNYVLSTVVQPDGKILLGGGFDSVNGVARPRLARLLATGESDSEFNSGFDSFGGISSLALQQDGKILAGGSFNSVHGQTRNGIARLLTNGLLEDSATFNSGTGTAGARFNTVGEITLKLDAGILLGGAFDTVNGEARKGLASLLPNGNVEPLQTFSRGAGPAGVLNPDVNAAVVQPDGKMLLAGAFTTFDGQPRNGIARLLPDGTLESTSSFNPGTGTGGGEVHCAVLQPDGKILLGGSFTTINGQTRRGLARLLPDGSLESTATFNPGTGISHVSVPWVSQMVLQVDGKIIIAGQFTTVNGQARNHIARLLPNGNLEPLSAFDPGTGSDQSIVAMALQADGKILIGGNFSTVSGQPRTLVARLNNGSAIQTLNIPDRSLIQWMRSGTVPEVNLVQFEVSTDGGATWRLHGHAARIAGGWAMNSGRLPPVGRLRARGRTYSGSAGTGLVGSEAAFEFPAPEITVQDGTITGPELADSQAAPVDFGTTRQTSPVIREFSISNTGTAPLLLNAVTLPAGFTILNPPVLPATVAINGSLTLIVRLDAAAPGTFGGGVSLTSDDFDESVFDFPVTGTVVTPEINLHNGATAAAPELSDGQSAPVDFGTVRQGTPQTMALTVASTGTAPLLLSSITVPPGYTALDLPPLPVTIAVAQSLTFRLQMDAAAQGTLAGSVAIVNDDLDEPIFDFPVTATVVSPEIALYDGEDNTRPPVMNAQAVPMDFGTIRQSAPLLRPLAIINEGTAPLRLTEVRVTGTEGIVINDGLVLPLLINPGTTLNVELKATAAATGTFSGNVRILSDDLDEGEFTFPVTVTVVSPEIAVNDGDAAAPELSDGQAAPVDFGRNVQGSPRTRSFTVTNSGSAELLVSSVTAPPGYTTLNVPPLPITIGIHQSATFQISLTTLTVGTHAGSVIIASDDLDEALFDFPLTGEVFIPDPVSSVIRTTTVLNRQTGLREQTIHIANDTTATVPAYNLIIRGLPDGVEVNNASERRPDGSWVVHVRESMNPRSTQDILLEYFSANRAPVEIAPQVSTEVVLNPPELPVPGVPGFVIDRVLRMDGGSVLIEFPTTPGRQYQVQYSHDGTNWKASLPSIRASANRTQWLDRGLPRTSSHPSAHSSRFYRVAELAP